MAGQIERLGVQMHGVTLTLQADNPRLITYARDHLHDLVTEPFPAPDLLVNCQWSEREWDPELNPFPTDGTLNPVGNRMLGRVDELIWLDTLRMRGLQLRFRRDGGRFVFDVSYRFQPKRATVDSVAAYEHKKFFSLMRYVIYHPLIWYLQSFRGWTMLHASGVDSPYGSIVFAGLAGVGKSTACVALMQRTGARIISENILLTDGLFIYPCYEPIRLDEGSMALLGNNTAGLNRINFPEGIKEKALFHPTQALPERVKPAAIFLPQFSGRPYLKRLSPDLAAEKIIAINALVRELDDYNWYAAALAYLWPRVGQAAAPTSVLQSLVRKVPCFELGIDRSLGVEGVRADIVGILTELKAARTEKRREGERHASALSS